MEAFDIVGVAGDWHGNTGWAGIAIARFAELGIQHILHLGDFGFWPGNNGQKYLYKTNKRLAANGQVLYVTLGNHEDYVQISRLQQSQFPGWRYNPEYPHILVADRGARWEWNGRTFVSLGGANSIDFIGRTENRTWWKAEQITLDDVFKTVMHGHADIMLAHDCPAGVNLFGSHREDHGIWSPTEMRYANQSRAMMRQAVDGVKPDLFLHGHYHFFADHETVLNDGLDEYTLHSIGLDMDGSKNNLAILELSTLDLEIIPMSWNALKEHYVGR
jgi:hypothetical protein